MDWKAIMALAVLARAYTVIRAEAADLIAHQFRSCPPFEG